MCGIFIIKSNKNINNYLNKFKASLSDLYSRGPDSQRYLKKNNYLIGFTRLGINELKRGDQPFESEDKRFTVVFNGEILNYKALIEYLISKQVVLKKFTEVEIILHLFILHKKKFLDYLRGFFSIVIIDHKNDRVFACVDQFSVKPLYYYYDEDLLVFSSNLSPILNNKIVKKDYDHNEIISFVALGRELNNRTIYRNIKKLKASTYLLFSNKTLTTHNYWYPFKKKIYSFPSEEKTIEQVLNEVVNTWKTSDVKLANTKSNGVDSNILNFFFEKNDIKIKNFSIIESKKHHSLRNEIIVSKNSFKIRHELKKYLKENLDPIPLANSSSLSLFKLYQSIHEKNYRVSFNGEGADEIFGGYQKYLKHLNLLDRRKGDFYKSFLDLYQNEINLSIDSICKKNFNLYQYLLNQIKKIKINSRSNLNKILEFDQKTWIPSVIKRHDAIGMFYSLEVRPPFLDQKFVNFANKLSSKFKIYKKNQKVILKNILKQNLNYSPLQSKLGTPSLMNNINSYKKYKKNLKEQLFYGELSKIYNPVKIWKIFSEQENGNRNQIFLWRVFVLTQIL